VLTTFTGASTTCLQAMGAQQMTNRSDQYEVCEETIGQKSFEVCKAIVKASPQHIFSVLTNYESSVAMFPGVRKCVVLENSGSTKHVAYRVEPGVPLGPIEYVLQVKETKPTLIEWHRLRGDLKEIDGFWKLEPIDGGRSTLVTYWAHLNIGRFIPQALVKHQVRSGMPGILMALKAKAEAPTIVASR